MIIIIIRVDVKFVKKIINDNRIIFIEINIIYYNNKTIKKYHNILFYCCNINLIMC